MQLLIVCFLVMMAVYFGANLLIMCVVKNRLVMEQRLAAYSPQAKLESVIKEELSRPFKERLLKPILMRASALPARVMPGVSLESFNQKLILAGNPGNLSAPEFVGLKFFLMFLMPGVLLMFSLLFSLPIDQSILLVAASGLFGFIFPDLCLKVKIRGRQEEIRKLLPEVLDLLTVSVEAGLGFDAAIAKVVEKMEGSLPEEFGRLMQEIKMGKPRKEAMKDLRDRVNVEDLSNFISSIIQADQLGVSMGGVLRLQAKEGREKRRHAAQEKAMKAPVKMVIPLVLFIFPAIFIVLLGPAMLKIIDAFSKM